MKEIDPEKTDRTAAFKLWMHAPMPMVTFFKTLNVARLVNLSRRGYKFNMLLCWCIGKAASGTKQFYLLPMGDKLMRFDRLAVNVIVPTHAGGIAACDIPFSDDVKKFGREYDQLTARVSDTGQAYEAGDDYMVIGTSALTRSEIDGAVNIYAGIYNNPFLIWSRYKKYLFKTILRISFQFHHTQMDGNDAAAFLERLQREIDSLKI